MSHTGQLLGYVGIAAAGLMLGLALTLLAVQAGRHLGWSFAHKLENVHGAGARNE